MFWWRFVTDLSAAQMSYFMSAVLFPPSDMHEFIISGFLFCHNQSDVFLVNFFYNVVAAQMCCYVSAACVAWCVCRVFIMIYDFCSISKSLLTWYI